MKGKLIVGGFNIGNFKDTPQRTIEAIYSSDVIVAEHAEFFDYFLDIKNKKTNAEIINYLPELNNKKDIIKKIVNYIFEGKNVLLIVQEGMPLINDPGFEIVKDVVESGLNITVIPGPTAPISALCVSGFSSDKFIFNSDIPEDPIEALKIFNELKNESRSVIFFDKTISIKRNLLLLSESVGGQRRVCICINLTKEDERVITTQINYMIEWVNSSGFEEVKLRDSKITLVVEGVINWAAW